MENPLEGMKNHMWTSGMSLTLLGFLLCKKGLCTMVMFFPKRVSFLSTSLSYPNFLAFLLVFPSSCPNGSTTCSFYSPRNVTRYIRTGLKPWFLHLNLNTTIVLCNDWRTEKACQCQVVERRATLLLFGKQTLDKEKDIKNTKSGTYVSNSGPTQAQPTRGVL